ncbi:beta-ketoacyl synthase domain-containing protein [Colletotrichum truncatum]|uniref:Beta-ketoacyl synthase domain-containing protein n=1 Tax=Colletotrichum truncatum TaxID=5467 RepID=A0ACC3Z2C0_COLTU|nr:beta-ketoacyl synthase domain-containing protein [Colletotrichum truncatum]XP_036579069.1 beta-ketoacyl synthase domain-containing protein [Colletotrichum truncatum]KAF6780830.1 beta-ketoacyl synthase domain-containing protein [Colletotrichum truncatum]KAF6786500.1 beta-ketoacyl synthase domain-containing protein [Colletotrichum truncatum]
MWNREPIAIVGSACRFPGGVDSPSKFWEVLQQPGDLQSEVPKQRFSAEKFFHPDGMHHGSTNTRYGYFLKEPLGAFDAPFFNIQAGEAESMDPQQRLLLETTYDALSSAGLVQELQGSDTAVYVGLMTHDFETIKTQDMHHMPTYFATGVAASIASNRLSYVFDWHGPSMTIDTACSSSLVAVHHAVQQLRSAQSRVAVAAGANMILSPLSYVSESKLNMLSPTGRSRMWDAAADGYARGEGVAAVILKTLQQALSDGDHIESIIRETGVNQDGKTIGITMPSHLAQEALIRETYARAGLDLNRIDDRPQFFEAHGTGTPAGDPQEAEAIANAFFRNKLPDVTQPQDLLVGSVKTVIGHTEGTAGLAGLLKASLAVQHGVIPPNQHFEKLNPAVQPFYHHVSIPTEVQPWPQVTLGHPRRASVNSFGFGGTNAHCIIEEHVGSGLQELSSCKLLSRDLESQLSSTTYGMPLVFSAKSQRSLKENMDAMLRFLESDPSVDMADLAWTLMQKQAVLPIRHAISSHTCEGARLALEAAIKDNLGIDFSSSRGHKSTPQILGIFTGQGVQWPHMCKSLLASIPLARDIIDELDTSLQTLPTEYRPTWTLQQQLFCDGVESNAAEAGFSQPLCAAVQLVLIRLLEAAGIKFTAIVGHSSGEIACAAAAGYITPFQAIRVAYLRGLAVTTSRVTSPSGAQGAMLAAEISYDDAKELCNLEEFEGRICIAAYNAPTSVTLSGDVDALEHVEAILKDEDKFVRFLRVDKAYHSHHMISCGDTYIKALSDCDCAVSTASKAPESCSPVAWYSSVYEGRLLKCTDITADYWKANLVSPVLFSQAVERAVGDHDVACGVEVGAHPALKRPTVATIHAIYGTDLPYIGCMKRGQDDMDAFAEALAYFWERFACFNILKADSFMRTVSPSTWPRRSLTKVIPRYAWDHTRTHWTETRATKAFLTGTAPHLLLGSPLPSTTDLTFQWQSFIKPRDDEWLEGHDLQSQPILPAAGYVVMAMEAALHVAKKRVPHDIDITVLEVLDLSIDKAISFDDKNSMAELLVTLKVMDQSDQQLSVEVSIDSALDRETKPSTSASGRVVVTFSSSLTCLLQRGLDEPLHPNNIDINSFYRELEFLGLDYTSKYRGVRELCRADGRAAGRLSHYRLPNSSLREIVLHPATLDTAFQTIMGAFSYPGDKALRSTVVPVHIDRIALAPGACASALSSCDEVIVLFNSTCSSFKDSILTGHVEVFDDSSVVLFQVDNIVLQPLYRPEPSADHLMFTKTVWGPYVPDRILDRPEFWATDEDKRMIPIIERIVYNYVKELLSKLTLEDRRNASLGLQRYIHWNEQVLDKARQWQTTFYEADWELDTAADVEKLCDENWYHPYVRLVKRVSENVISTIRDNTNPFHWMNADGLLSEFYASPLSNGPCWNYGKHLIGQICHRFPNMNILEIGAGTGSATRYILDVPQLGFNSYTFTDISATFFENAREVFSQYKDLMDFRKLDITQDPASTPRFIVYVVSIRLTAGVVQQGFTPHSYDLVIASSVLHATPHLVETMTNVRSLLKLGGHVVIAEATFKEYLRTSYIFGLFPDWWAGYEDGRILDPFASYEEWDAILKQAGFSGIDSRTSDRESWVFQNSLFSAHAINPKVEQFESLLHTPPRQKDDGANMPQLVFVGGCSGRSSALLDKLQAKLSHRRILRLDCLQTMFKQAARLETGSTFVVASELDDEMFDDLDDIKLEAAKSLFSGDYAKAVIWITEAAFTHNPRQAMTIGLLRTIQLENPNIHVQNIDMDNAEHSDYPALIAQHIIELEGSPKPPEDSSDLIGFHEPEIYLVDGHAWIPRIKHDIARNNRLNSASRAIFADARPDRVPLRFCLAEDGASSYLEFMDAMVSPCPPSPPSSLSNVHDDDLVQVQVNFALTGAIRVGNLGFFHLCQGFAIETETPVVVLAENNASVIRVPASRVFSLPSGEKCILLHIVASLISQRIMSNAVPGTSVLVFDAPRFCVHAIEKQAKRNNVQAHFATSQQLTAIELKSGSSWTYLDLWVSERALKKMVTAKVSVYCDFSFATEHGAAATLGRRLAKIQPPHCAKYDSAHFFAEHGSGTLYDNFNCGEFAIAVEQALLASSAVTDDHVMVGAAIIKVADMQFNEAPMDLTTIIDWRTTDTIQARLRPIDAGSFLAPDKTYLLAGLAKTMGRSLARWIVTHGGRYVVLSSRHPETPDCKWIEEMEELGGYVTVLPMDLSNERALDEGLSKIRKTLPPIRGIAYGPLVLRDTMLQNMTLADMNLVLNSKVIGARLLHERFCDANAETPLNFFVMFSSGATVGGTPGQSNYNAANAYLQALAQYRRTKGLAASTIHVGAVMGIGYLARTHFDEQLLKVHDMGKLAEGDFHTLFAEAIVSGQGVFRQSEGKTTRMSVTDMSDIEVITGFPVFEAKNKNSFKLWDNPRFGHLRTPENHLSYVGQGSSTSRISIKDRLREAATKDEAQNAIIHGLAQKTRDILLIPADQSVNVNAALLDQGMDSLGAVAVSGWFSQELLVDIPILRVLSGASLEDLAEEAVRRLPRDAIPLIALNPEECQPEASVSSTIQSPTSSSMDSSLTSGKPSVNSARTSMTLDASGDDQASTKTLRRHPLSIGQTYSWKLQQQLSRDCTIFHNTIAYLFEGYIDLQRLGTAVDEVILRHEILRTAFLAELQTNEGNDMTQVILDTPTWSLNCTAVADQASAEEAMKQLHREGYDLESGKTFKIVDFHWSSAHHHLLVIAYHRLAGDGATTSALLSEICALYNGAVLPVAVPQFSKISNSQRVEYEQGRLDADIAYWMFQYNNKVVPIMPILDLPHCLHTDRNNSPPCSWYQHTGVFRLSSAVSTQVKEAVRQQKVSRMQFFMTVYAALLSRLTSKNSNSEDGATNNNDDDDERMITIGVADTNRATVEDMAAMGFFANLLPVRIKTREKGGRSSLSPIQQLGLVKKAMRGAMQHARVPYSVLLERLPVTPTMEVLAKDWPHAPLFQAVFDYAGGGVESVRIGNAVITEQGGLRASELVSRERTPYDVVLEICADPTRDPLVIVKLQSSLYGSEDVIVFHNAFVELITKYSADLM